MKSVLLALLALCAAAPARAGGWISGGTGELAGDGGNPWFLAIPEQPQKISYCVDGDTDAMGVRADDLQRAVNAAIGYWTGQIVSAPSIETAGVPAVRVLADNFAGTGLPCRDGDGTDLQFQFGRLATAEQQKLVDDQHIDLRHFIGFAARTGYDQTLRGRGFIYIAPQSGPLRPEGDRLLPTYWSDVATLRLQAVVRHELGHVFGVPHVGGATSLMGEAFPENVVSVSDFRLAFGNALQASTFRVGDGNHYDRCLSNYPQLPAWPATLARALRLGAGDNCLRFYYDAQGMSIFAREASDLAWRPIAAFRPADGTVRERSHEIVRIWLPAKRTVLTGVPATTTTLPGPAVVETMMAGRLSGSGFSTPASLTIDPTAFQLSAVVDGQLVPNIFDGLDDSWRPIGRR